MYANYVLLINMVVLEANHRRRLKFSRIIPSNMGSLCFLDMVTEVKGRFVACSGRKNLVLASGESVRIEDIPVGPLTLLTAG